MGGIDYVIFSNNLVLKTLSRGIVMLFTFILILLLKKLVKLLVKNLIKPYQLKYLIVQKRCRIWNKEENLQTFREDPGLTSRNHITKPFLLV